MDGGSGSGRFPCRANNDGEKIPLTKPSLQSVAEETPLTFAPTDDHGLSLRKSGFAESVRKLRSATLAVSILEKPSDDRNASAWLAGWNVTNLIQGTGILGVPYAVLMGGWAAVAIIVVVAAVCCYTGKLLVDCLYEDSKRTGQRKRVRINYPEVGEAAWPGWGNKIVSVVQVCEMFGGVIMYIVLLATVFSDILNELTPLDIYQWAVVCAYCAHAVFPGVEGCMREPKQFPVMMNCAFALAAVVKMLLGMLAVLRFGQNTEQVITVNMSIRPVFNIVATVLVVTNVFLAFPLCMFVVLETWDAKILPYFPHLGKETRYHWFWLLLTRIMLLTLALFLAVIVPHFGLLMGFIGSFTGTCLSFVFPCVFHMILKWKTTPWYSILTKIFVTIFGLVCGGFGLVFSGKELAKAFSFG
ncbi:Vesicular inhibitory amino acid transporter [Stylophora pistillata]|uniref:Vesicular inhibitory amino acid transporter n=1 Tax=Stylophora pistillata TaxID=50429 RepID=A0A2B4SIT8_STYPI|nr:Vesicular inhibitory amino acid transporter [Stylophora pistillata]